MVAAFGGRATFSMRERLQQLIRDIESRPTPRSASSIARPAHVEVTDAALDWMPTPLAGTERRSTAAGMCTYREQSFPLAEHVVGSQPLASLHAAGSEELSLLTADLDVEPRSSEILSRLLFLDIETTGLGGAGAMVFLVAIGHVEAGALRMRQYLAESPAEEAALLDALVEDVHASIPRPILVTYNGRTFDAPMLDSRATMHRRRFGFDSLPHVDVLPPARTLYRGWLPSCRLLDVESRVLGVTRPSADVDGAEVPAWYFRFLRSGDMRFVEPIASHNLLDVLSLAALTGRIAALVRGDEEPRGSEALGTARLLARREPQRAIALLEETAPRDVPRRADLVWQLAGLLKRQGLHERAVPFWQELADSHGPWSVRALEELAKYCEHRSRDFTLAAEHVDRALTRLAPVSSRFDPDDRTAAAFRHRRQRLTLRMDRESRGA